MTIKEMKQIKNKRDILMLKFQNYPVYLLELCKKYYPVKLLHLDLQPYRIWKSYL